MRIGQKRDVAVGCKGGRAKADKGEVDASRRETRCRRWIQTWATMKLFTERMYLALVHKLRVEDERKVAEKNPDVNCGWKK